MTVTRSTHHLMPLLQHLKRHQPWHLSRRHQLMTARRLSPQLPGSLLPHWPLYLTRLATPHVPFGSIHSRMYDKLRCLVTEHSQGDLPLRAYETTLYNGDRHFNKHVHNNPPFKQLFCLPACAWFAALGKTVVKPCICHSEPCLGLPSCRRPIQLHGLQNTFIMD